MFFSVKGKKVNLMKKFFTLLLVLSFFLIFKSANACELHSKNSNGVILSSRELAFIQALFYDGFEEHMTSEDYNNIFSHGITADSEIEKIDNSGIMPFATTHTTANKSITIGKACTTANCLITLVASWINNPNTRSYDVIGAYFSGTRNITSPTTSVQSSTGANSYSNTVSATNGVGCSVKLPDNGSNIKITQYFYVTRGGIVYGSYQHAMYNISLANSKKYTFSNAGYGGVFEFDNSVRSYYDQMAGVYISV